MSVFNHGPMSALRMTTALVMSQKAKLPRLLQGSDAKTVDVREIILRKL